MHYFWNRGNGTLRDILSVVTLMRKFMFKKGGTSVPSFLRILTYFFSMHQNSNAI